MFRRLGLVFLCVASAGCSDSSGTIPPNHLPDGSADAPGPADAPALPDAPADAPAGDAMVLTCGVGGPEVMMLPPSGIASGSAPLGPSQFMGSCGGSGAEAIYQFHVGVQLSSLTATTDLPQTSISPVLYLRSVCDQPSSERACAIPGAGPPAVTLPNPPLGDYYVFVDTNMGGPSGVYALKVSGLIPEGQPCDPQSPLFSCGPGRLCVERTTGQGTHCERARCADGLDNDGDGKIDFPNDPGCTEPEDDDESDDCGLSGPAGPNCPQCGNRIDDDGDGLIDYPADPGCGSASDPSESDDCIPGVPVDELDANGHATGATAAGMSSFMGVCGGYMTAGPERVLHYRVSQPTRQVAAVLSAPAFGGGALVYVRRNVCSDVTAQLACAGPGLSARALAEGLVPGDNLFFFVDSEMPSQWGAFDLQLEVALEMGATCDPAVTWRHCATGLKCAGNLCVPTQCADGIDNDGDLWIDYPLDPGCSSLDDDNEGDDTCRTNPTGPGNNCPQCGNGIDDDGDGLIDYQPVGAPLPSDPGCLDRADPDENDDCVPAPGLPSVPVADITATGMATGTTVGAGNAFTPACTISNAPERVFLYRLARPVSRLTASLCGSDPNFDTALYIRLGSCRGTEVGCDDDTCMTQSVVNLSNVAAGNYYIFVDGYMMHEGAFVLTVTATP